MHPAQRAGLQGDTRLGAPGYRGAGKGGHSVFEFTATDKDGASAPVAMEVAVAIARPLTDLAVGEAGGSVALSILSQAGVDYALEYATNLVAQPVS